MTIAAGYGTVSDIEVMLVLISSIGFLFAVWNTHRAYGDVNYLHKNKMENGKWFVAKLALVSEVGRAYLQAVFMFIGIRAFFYPDPPPEIGVAQYVTAAILRWAFLLGAVVICAKTVYSWYVRMRLVEHEKTQNDL